MSKPKPGQVVLDAIDIAIDAMSINAKEWGKEGEDNIAELKAYRVAFKKMVKIKHLHELSENRTNNHVSEKAVVEAVKAILKAREVEARRK